MWILIVLVLSTSSDKIAVDIETTQFADEATCKAVGRSLKKTLNNVKYSCVLNQEKER